MTALYHYTCRDGLEGIREAGWVLKPNWHPLLAAELVWLTDMGEPGRVALGLTSHSLRCDRTEYRLAIQLTPSAVPWWQWCRREGVTRARRDLLELPGTKPLTWWVSPEAVPVEPI